MADKNDILKLEGELESEIATIGDGTKALVDLHTADTATIAELKAQIAGGASTDDLSAIADALASTNKKAAAIASALHDAIPTPEAPATDAPAEAASTETAPTE